MCWSTSEPVMMDSGPMRPHMMGAFVNGMGVDMSQVEGTSGTEQETIDRVKNAWLEVQWEGKTLDVLIMNWGDGQCQSHHHWLLADSEALARHFFAAVCQWNMEIRGEVLVFDNGGLHKGPPLFFHI